MTSDHDPRLLVVEQRLANLEQALQRLVLMLADRHLLTQVEVDAVRELLPEGEPPQLKRPPTTEAHNEPSVTSPSPAVRPRPSTRSEERPREADKSTAGADRAQIGRLGAHTRWAKEEDRSAATQAARDGLLKRFEDEVDPERRLPADERARRAESARRAFYQRIAMKSAAARAARKGGGKRKPVDSDGE